MITVEQLARNIHERIIRCDYCDWSARDLDLGWLYAKWCTHMNAHEFWQDMTAQGAKKRVATPDAP